MSLLKGFFGPPNIEKLKAKRDINGLIKALDCKQELSIRQAACEALVNFGQQAIEKLVLSLKEDNTREYVVLTLDKLDWQPKPDLVGAYYWSAKQQWDKCIRIGSPAIEPLIAEMKNVATRDAAAAALATIGEPAVPMLINAIKDKELRSAVLSTLIQIGAPSVKPLLNAAVRFWAEQVQILDTITKIGDKAVDSIITALQTALQNNDERILGITTQLLGEIGDERAIQPLISTFSNKSWRDTYIDKSIKNAFTHKETSSWEPVVALARIGPPAVESLIAVLQKEDNYVQQYAAEALGKIGDQRAVEPLIAEALNDKVGHVTYDAIKALGNIGDPRAVQPLMSLSKGNISIGYTASVNALVKIGKPSIESAIAALSDNDVDTRAGAVMILARIGEPAVEPLIASIKKMENQSIQNTMSLLLTRAKKEDMKVKRGIWAAKNCSFHIKDLESEFDKVSMTPPVGKIRPNVTLAREVITLIQEVPSILVAFVAALHPDEKYSVIDSIENAISKLI